MQINLLLKTNLHYNGLVWFYSISTIVDYLITNSVFTYVLNI